MVWQEIDVDDVFWNLFNARLDAAIQEALKSSVRLVCGILILGRR